MMEVQLEKIHVTPDSARNDVSMSLQRLSTGANLISTQAAVPASVPCSQPTH